MGETYRVAIARGVTKAGEVEETFACMTVGTGKVGDEVGNRGSGVMVGTGVKRDACKVPTRSCGVPFDGISVMICMRIFSLIGGTLKEYESRL